MLKMKDLPKDDRPRERLKKEGVESLSNEELLSILLNSGGKDGGVKELSISLLKEAGGIHNFLDLNYEKLVQMKGIGPAKACTLLAALEYGKRVSIKKMEGQKLRDPKTFFEYYRKILGEKRQEYFYCIYLDSKKRVIKEKLLFIGTLNQSLVHPREVFKEAFLVSASSFLCVHNHPSSDVTPSKADTLLTRRLKEIGDLMGIPLEDHIIIGRDSYYSFYEGGKL